MYRDERSSFFESDNWTTSRYVHDHIEKCDGSAYGEFDNFFEMHRYQSTFALASQHNIYPGAGPNSCDSSSYWECHRVNATHDWPSDKSMSSREPSGSRDGEYSQDFTLTYGAPSISWTNTVPDISRTDYSSSDLVDIRWKWNDNRDESETLGAGSITPFYEMPYCWDSIGTAGGEFTVRDIIGYNIYKSLETSYGFAYTEC